jgi:hypothetical protein
MAIVDTLSILGGTQGLQQLGYLFGSEVLGGRAREEQRLQDLIRQLSAQPQTTLAPQQQLGPVVQAPSFEIPGVTSPWPEAPAAPSLASNMFAPSRATWGNEALFPQGGATGGPYGLTEADVAAGGPLVAGLREYERRFTTPQTTDTPGLERWLAMQPSAPPEVVGGATAYPAPAEPPGAPPPLPYTAAPFRPGGERLTEVQPGKSFAEILTQRPELAQTLIRSYPLLQAIKAEESERQAQREWARAFGAPATAAGGPGLLAAAGGPGAPGPPSAPGAAAPGAPPSTALQSQRAGLRRSLDVLLNNPQLLGTKRGQELLSQLKTASEVLTAEEKGETERVTMAEVKDFRTRALGQAAEADARGDPVDAMRWRAMAQNPTQSAQILKDRDLAQQTTARRDLFTQYAADERRRGNEAGAQIYEAAALDKESAEIVFKHREAARKDALEGTGAAAWKPWRDTFGDDVAGELAGTPGLQPNQVTDVHIRRAIDNINREKTGRAKAGAPTVAVDVKWGPQESEDLSNQLVAVDNYRRVAEMIRKHPEGWGGPGGLIGKTDKLLAAAGWGDAERTRARLDIEQSSSLLRKAITGTAMAAHEEALTAWIPTGTESLPLLLAKLEATAKNIERATYYRVQLKKGADPTKLPKMATPEGDVDLTAPAPPPPASPSPPAAGRTPESQNARKRLQEHGILP